MPDDSYTMLAPDRPQASDDSAFSMPICASTALASDMLEATPEGTPM